MLRRWNSRSLGGVIMALRIDVTHDSGFSELWSCGSSDHSMSSLRRHDPHQVNGRRICPLSRILFRAAPAETFPIIGRCRRGWADDSDVQPCSLCFAEPGEENATFPDSRVVLAYSMSGYAILPRTGRYRELVPERVITNCFCGI